MRYLSDSPSLPLARSWCGRRHFFSCARIGSNGPKLLAMVCTVEKLAAARLVEMNPPLKGRPRGGSLVVPRCPAIAPRKKRERKEAAGGERGTGERANGRRPVLWRRRALGQRAVPSVVVDRIYEVAGPRIGGVICRFPVGCVASLTPPSPRKPNPSQPVFVSINIHKALAMPRCHGSCQHHRRTRYGFASIRVPNRLRRRSSCRGGTPRWKLVASDRPSQSAHH